MTSREIYAVERARYRAKMDVLFAELRQQLQPIPDHIPHGKTAEYSRAWYERNKARISAERAAKRTPRRTVAA